MSRRARASAKATTGRAECGKREGFTISTTDGSSQFVNHDLVHHELFIRVPFTIARCHMAFPHQRVDARCTSAATRLRANLTRRERFGYHKDRRKPRICWFSDRKVRCPGLSAPAGLFVHMLKRFMKNIFGSRFIPCLLLAASLFATSVSTWAQQEAVSPALRPPKGAQVAIVVFEDLQCPDCRRAAPLVEEAARSYKIPWGR